MVQRGRPKGNYTQYRRLSQLRELLEHHPKGVPVAEIAVRLGVTDRSVRRYLRELEREVDVERTSSPDGFGPMVRIPSRDLPRRVKLHRTQIYGLLMARRVFRMLEGTAFEQTLREAMDQLIAHVQRPARRGATVDPDTRLQDRFLYLPANPMRSFLHAPDAAEVVDIMLDACAQLRVCRIVYRKAGGTTEQLTVHPYAIVLYKDTIYCVAHVVERDATRTLRLDRFLDAEADPIARFVLPEDFSVDDHFAGHFGVHTGGEKTKIVAEFDARVADLIRTRSFPGEGGGEAKCEELPDGGVRLTMVVGITPEVRSFLLSFGESVKVLEPRGLVADLVRELRTMLRHYEPGNPSAATPAAPAGDEGGGVDSADPEVPPATTAALNGDDVEPRPEPRRTRGSSRSASRTAN